MVSKPLGMISGRRRDYAAVALFFSESEQLVQRSAFLESSGSLQIVELEVNGVARELREGLRPLARREIDGFANASQCRFDVGESNHLVGRRQNILQDASKYESKA